jgi:hypothetical protein
MHRFGTWLLPSRELRDRSTRTSRRRSIGLAYKNPTRRREERKMSVMMVMRVQGDTERFRNFAETQGDTLREIAEDAKGKGCVHHRFAVGDGYVLVIDEWESPEAFALGIGWDSTRIRFAACLCASEVIANCSSSGHECPRLRSVAPESPVGFRVDARRRPDSGPGDARTGRSGSVRPAPTGHSLRLGRSGHAGRPARVCQRSSDRGVCISGARRSRLARTGRRPVLALGFARLPAARRCAVRCSAATASGSRREP